MSEEKGQSLSWLFCYAYIYKKKNNIISGQVLSILSILDRRIKTVEINMFTENIQKKPFNPTHNHYTWTSRFDKVSISNVLSFLCSLHPLPPHRHPSHAPFKIDIKYLE